MWSSGSTGGYFKRQLHFYPAANEAAVDEAAEDEAAADEAAADETDTSDCWIIDEELRESPRLINDTEEKIEHADYYSHPLWSKQWTNLIFFHAFIVIRTSNWWWSIEKNRESITIQRSKNLECVRDMYLKEKRTTGPIPWTWICKNQTTPGGNTTIKELIDYMWRKDVVNEDYHVISSNCQKFAALIFDRIESPQNHQVYFDPDADQETEHSCYMTAEQVLSQVQSLYISETLTELELYQLEEFRVQWFVMDPLFWIGVGIVVFGYSLVKDAPNDSLLTLVFFLSPFLFLSSKMFFAVSLIFIQRFYEGREFDIISVVVLMVLFFISLLDHSKKNGHSFYPIYSLLIIETNKKTYWSFEQVLSFSNKYDIEYLVSIQRTTNKDILLKEHQRKPRNPVFTTEHLLEKTVAKGKDIIAVLNFIWKKDYLDTANDSRNFTLAPATGLAQIVYDEFKEKSNPSK